MRLLADECFDERLAMRPRTGVVILRAGIADLEGVAVRLVHLIERAGNDLSNAITVMDDRGVRSRPII